MATPSPEEVSDALRAGILQALTILDALLDQRTIPEELLEREDFDVRRYGQAGAIPMVNAYGPIYESVFDQTIDGATRVLRFWAVLDGLANVWRETCERYDIDPRQALNGLIERNAS